MDPLLDRGTAADMLADVAAAAPGYLALVREVASHHPLDGLDGPLPEDGHGAPDSVAELLRIGAAAPRTRRDRGSSTSSWAGRRATGPPPAGPAQRDVGRVGVRHDRRDRRAPPAQGPLLATTGLGWRAHAERHVREPHRAGVRTAGAGASSTVTPGVLVDRSPDLELLARLCVVCSRCTAPGHDLDALDTAPGKAILDDGRVYVGTTVYRGATAPRPAMKGTRLRGVARPDPA